MTAWTPAQIDALAPDAKSIKAAQKLRTLSRWSNLGATEAALWGECRGSGKKPYQTRIDLNGPAFKCSCPSRKFPCKHGLALFYVYAQQADSFSNTAPPEWVAEWIASRAAKQKPKVTRDPGKPVDAVAQAKRQEARAHKVQGGIVELERWLHDIVRAGLTELASKRAVFYTDMAARLVDAQAPGLARRVRELALLRSGDPDWASTLLGELGNLQLLISAYKQIDQLPTLVATDVKRAIGWPDPTQDLLQQQGVVDDWQVLAMQMSVEDKLRTRKAWLWGQHSGKAALIIDHAFGQLSNFKTQLGAGQKWRGELVFYPSMYELRALIKVQQSPQLITAPDFATAPHTSNFDTMLDAYSAAIAANCWLPGLPVVLHQLTPIFTENGFRLRDQHNQVVPLAAGFQHSWKLMAVSGGHPIDLVAEWDGAHLMPLSIWDETLVVFDQEV